MVKPASASTDSIPLDELPPCKLGVSRRAFCGAAGVGLVTLGLAACDSGGTTPMDSPDFAGSAADLAQSPSACGAGLINCGDATAIAVNTAKEFTDNSSYDFFLCRDAQGLFTVDAACTHAGCTVRLSAGAWRCPCHGARFSFNGQNPTSPAPSPLANYAVCVDAGGVAWVDYNTMVSPTTRA